MKRLILALLILTVPLSALAATLSCDPQPGVERYEFTGLGEITESTAQVATGTYFVKKDDHVYTQGTKAGGGGAWAQ